MSKKMEQSARVAAFFDIDGTLVSRPSLEWRFFGALRYRKAIPWKNYLLWLMRAARLAPRGIQMMRHANKMYLRGVSVDNFKESRQRQGQPRLAAPRFFPEGVDQVAWHAEQGHAIVLVSGTPAPLAQEMALGLVMRLAVRGIAASVGVCATRLAEIGGRWTGQIEGEAMFGEGKGRAVQRLALERGLDLERCYAYGDSVSDRWILEAVGKPTVVNPSWRMERLARRQGWAMLTWAEKRKLTQSARKTRSTHRTGEELWDRGRLHES